MFPLDTQTFDEEWCNSKIIFLKRCGVDFLCISANPISFNKYFKNCFCFWMYNDLFLFDYFEYKSKH